MVMQTARQADPVKLERIAIMTLDFSNLLKLPNNANGTLEVFDLAQMYADTYGVHNVEFQHSHILSTEPAFLKELRARLEKTQSRITNINLEFGAMSCSQQDPALRVQAIDLTKRWVDHAVLLGSPRVMINQGQLSHENKHYAIDALRMMGEYGRSKGVRVGVETRGNGPAGGGGRGAAAAAPAAATPAAAAPVATPPVAAGAPAQPPAGQAAAAGGRGGGRGTIPAGPPSLTVVPAWVLLSEVIKDSGTYANVDMGNVGAQTEGELFAALRTLLPMTTGNTHTRVNQFWDLASVVKFMTQSLGYTGLFSIETNGHDAVRNIYNIVLDSL
jgi:hypothetical protein